MFSTICLIFFIGFIFWMNTSQRISWPDKSGILARTATNPVYSRAVAFTFFLIGTILLVALLGWGSGLFSAIIVLMTVASLVVLFFPFRYLSIKGIVIIYICAITLELITF